MIQAPILFEIAGGASVAIVSFKNAVDAPVYQLRWTDNVINEWREDFTTLAQALARASVLSACADAQESEGTGMFFRNDVINFMADATEFFQEQVV